MLLHLKEMYEYKITSFFDPGQQLSVMTKEDLENAMNWADFLIINEVEFEEFKKIARKTDEEIINSFNKIILTY
jgi:sugar/nucleoside kinase (ribokinase family)